MKALLLRFLCAGLLALASAGTVQADDAPIVAQLLAQPVVLKGMLGDRQVELHLHRKPTDEEAVAGEYLIAGTGKKVLVAGEYGGNQISMEESENGVDVSGDWEGRLENNTFSGTWSSIDGSVTKPFALKAMHTQPPQPSP